MAHIYADRVRETSVTTGTGDFQLAGAVSGYRAFSTVMADGDTTDIEISMGSAMESVVVRYNSGTNTLARQFVHESSNSGSLVNFGVGTKDVFITLPAKVIERLAVAGRQNALLNYIYQSKSYGLYRRTISTFADGYASTDGINTGSSTNYTQDGATKNVGPSLSATTTTINSPNGTAGQSTLTWVDRSSALTNSITISSVGIYSTNAQTMTVKIVKQNSTSNFDIVVSESFVHPGGGWADKTLSSPYVVPGSGTYNLGAYYNGTADTKSAQPVSYIAGDQAVATGVSGWTVSGSNTSFPMRYTYGSGYNNMTVYTTAQTADASVSNGRVLLEIDNTATPTLNTDLTVEVTCNGGTNWTSASLSSVGIGQSGRKVVETVDQATTAGTSFAARVKTLNNKNIPIYGLAMSVH